MKQAKRVDLGSEPSPTLFKILVLIPHLTLGLLYGCSSSGGSAGPGMFTTVYERVPVETVSSAIYVYRPFQRFSGATDEIVKCGNDSATLSSGSYHRFNVKPGQSKCEVEYHDVVPIFIEAKPGRDYFVRLDLLMWGIRSLTLIDAENAQVAIAKCEHH